VGGRRSFRVAAATAVGLALLLVPAAAAGTRFDSAALDSKLRAEPGVLSVLVERNGRLVFERYYRGAARSARLDVFSVTKSVTSTLVGIALAEGKIRSLDQRLGDFFPKDVQRARDKRVRKITLRQLLEMRSGYRDIAAAQSDDWVRTQIDRPLGESPGRGWAYDNGSYHLLSAVLTKATGRLANAYAQRVLLGPLGIVPTVWATDGQGHNLGNTGLRLSSRDLLRIGDLYLHGGRWNGRQLLPAAYVHAATRRYTSLGYGSAGYGYGWWTFAGRPPGFAALGYGGQAVAVYPQRQLVVVVTGSGDNVQRVLDRLVLPALGIR
jgi:CubicO group peptidase (beta-lactamase class C family)